MKITLFIIGLLVLLSIQVMAQESQQIPIDTHEMDDFAKEPAQAVWVKTGDFIFFNLLSQRHSIRIEQVYGNNVKIVLYPDISSQPKGAYTPISKGKYIKVDLNKDDVTDMTIRLEQSQGGEWGDEGLLVFESLLQNEKVPETQGLVVSGEQPKKENNTLVFVAIGVGLLLGIIILLGLNKKKQSQ